MESYYTDMSISYNMPDMPPADVLTLYANQIVSIQTCRKCKRTHLLINGIFQMHGEELEKHNKAKK